MAVPAGVQLLTNVAYREGNGKWRLDLAMPKERDGAPPFLIVHGMADGTVPFSQGERFAKALKAAGAKDVTFMKFEGAGHGVFGQHSEQTYPAMEQFFARVLKLPDEKP